MCIVLYYNYNYNYNDNIGISRSVVPDVAHAATVLLPLRIMYTMRAISHHYRRIKIQLLLLVSPATNIPVFCVAFLGGAAPQYIYKHNESVRWCR
jgi:hypothetical protein